MNGAPVRAHVCGRLAAAGATARGHRATPRQLTGQDANRAPGTAAAAGDEVAPRRRSGASRASTAIRGDAGTGRDVQRALAHVDEDTAPAMPTGGYVRGVMPVAAACAASRAVVFRLLNVAVDGAPRRAVSTLAVAPLAAVAAATSTTIRCPACPACAGAPKRCWSSPGGRQLSTGSNGNVSARVNSNVPSAHHSAGALQLNVRRRQDLHSAQLARARHIAIDGDGPAE
mmetsp:Transcript_4959/g.14626  ORF Transcript_4959/g.14626 Transcript_4959/m.14626 type:complete len:229 (+) Transcript_4959:189-875(+)